MAKKKQATRSKAQLLAGLERLIGTDLPADYRAFMSNFDGKLPDDRSFKVRRDYLRNL